MEVRELSKKIREINRNNGWTEITPASWENGYEISTKFWQINQELSEAFQEWEKGDPEKFTIELADAVIRLFDLGECLDLPLPDAIDQKLEVNAGRGYRHNGKKI
jgi:NTP pyrophosphatase (non-canonical NTP hydrolase)